MDPISGRTSKMAVDVISEVVELFYCGQGRVNNGERVVHLGGDEVGDAWNTPALEQWTREHGKFHNRTDLVDYWISHTIAEVKKRTGARVILWNDFLDDHTTQADTIDTWQIWRYDTSQTLDMAASGKFGSLIYSSAFYLDLLGDDWATFYDVPLKRDGAGVIKGGEACMWGSHGGLLGDRMNFGKPREVVLALVEVVLNLKSVQASIADAAKRLTTDSDAWLSPELLKAVMANPSLAKGFADPRYQRVLRTMQEDPEKAKHEVAGDTDLAEWLRAFSALMSRHFEKLASESSPVPSLSPAGNTPSGDKNEISEDSEVAELEGRSLYPKNTVELELSNETSQRSASEEPAAVSSNASIGSSTLTVVTGTPRYLQSNPQAQLDPRQLPPQLAQKVMYLVEKGIVKLHA
ncbi:hypothetical protein FOZ60_001790 [Perkinsus olseni]|uniref:beta-N-acetylhexosaminidase n=1 Tax=Perkinsus olseni TaxID=32597 RepID=A0A7J6P0B1_PEROL|nr:hypothetical protein FOZ60_001790 [Perkinsus olseni]